MFGDYQSTNIKPPPPPPAQLVNPVFPRYPRRTFFYARAIDALLTFFECVRRNDGPCALPSKAADSVWHAWLRLAPAPLDAFCERHFGRRIPHVEASDMTGGMALPLARTLVTARRLDGLALAGPSVPDLFDTDRALCMPGGHAYEVRGNEVVCSDIGRHGVPVGAARVHPAMEPDYLLAAGLIAQVDYAGWQYRRDMRNEVMKQASVSGQVCDAPCEIAIGDGDGPGGDSGDSGGSCGSSCGSGCGSGCGGGCGS